MLYILTADGKKLLRCKAVTVERNLGGGREGKYCLSAPEHLVALEAYATEEEAMEALSAICDAMEQGATVYRMPPKAKSPV